MGGGGGAGYGLPLLGAIRRCRENLPSGVWCLMVQKEVSVQCVFAGVGWALAILFATASLVFPHVPLMGPTVLFAAVAATLNVRGFVQALERREQVAFQLGRDSVRSVR